MNGKGDRNRTTDRDAYDRGWERIFGGNTESTKGFASSDVGAIPTSSTIEDTGWKKVCHAIDVCEWDSENNELTDRCMVCGLDYSDSPCPGPTEDGWEYQYLPSGMWARKITTSSNGAVAQSVEHLICNQTVAGSIPVGTSIDNTPFQAPPIRHGIRRIIE